MSILKKIIREEIHKVLLAESTVVPASKIMKIFSDTAEWGHDIKLQVYLKNNNIIYIDSYYYGMESAKNYLIKKWQEGGMYYKYFKEEYGYIPKIVRSFEETFATGRHKKLTTDGVVGVELSFTKA